MSDSALLAEEILVILHASKLGRGDIINTAISSLKQADRQLVLSSRRQEDDLTPLHVAAICGHADIIRLLLVGFAFIYLTIRFNIVYVCLCVFAHRILARMPL